MPSYRSCVRREIWYYQPGSQTETVQKSAKDCNADIAKIKAQRACGPQICFIGLYYRTARQNNLRPGTAIPGWVSKRLSGTPDGGLYRVSWCARAGLIWTLCDPAQLRCYNHRIAHPQTDNLDTSNMAACYNLNQRESPFDGKTHVPCNMTAVENGGHSTCCPIGDYCLTNGMCKNAKDSESSNWYFRTACTDKTWNDPACPKYCEPIGASATTRDLSCRTPPY